MCINAIPKAWKTKSGILLTKWLKKHFYQQPKQKWDEKDSEIMDELIYELNQRPFLGSPCIVKFTDWLKSLKDKIQPKQEWSEKDEHWRQKAIDFMKHPDLIKATPTLAKDTIDWLKSIKDRVLPKQKQEWSEEEQYIIEDAACFILSSVNTAETKKEEERLEELADKLQDLRPQSHWKPSEEQMEVLKEATNIAGGKYKSCLNSLYSDLKKLREE